MAQVLGVGKTAACKVTSITALDSLAKATVRGTSNRPQNDLGISSGRCIIL